MFQKTIASLQNYWKQWKLHPVSNLFDYPRPVPMLTSTDIIIQMYWFLNLFVFCISTFYNHLQLQPFTICLFFQKRLKQVCMSLYKEFLYFIWWDLYLIFLKYRSYTVFVGTRNVYITCCIFSFLSSRYLFVLINMNMSNIAVGKNVHIFTRCLYIILNFTAVQMYISIHVCYKKYRLCIYQWVFKATIPHMVVLDFDRKQLQHYCLCLVIV